MSNAQQYEPRNSLWWVTVLLEDSKTESTSLSYTAVNRAHVSPAIENWA